VSELILEVLPFALGAFASPLPVIVAIVMLFTPRPRKTALVYLVTWALGLSAVTVLFILLAGFIGELDQPRGWVTWVRVAIGAALLVMAVKMWLGRESKQAPAWLSNVLESGPREAVRFGLLLSAANPKELLIALGAGLAIARSDAGVAAGAVALAVFVLLGAASVASPLLVFFASGDSALDRLTRAREWLQRNNAAVSAAVLAVLGLWLFVGGVLKL
jgi:threonine/homoserine/homoserine lactone efflux protein